MKRTRDFLIIFALCCLSPSRTFSQTLPQLPDFTKDDRVLVLAPHPDDETLGTGGVIQRAMAAGAKVQVACYTNGDHNELAFIVYERRLTLRTGEFLYMGELRRQETIEAMTSLGLSRKDMIFLGYPDFGTMAILTRFWKTPRPYRSLMTRISKVAYIETLSQGAPYVGESILKDIKTVLEAFRPTKIFVSSGADTNRDHQSLYLFTRIALWDLEGKIAGPAVYPYIIHVVGWPKPRGHHLELNLVPPAKLSGISWQELRLNPEEVKRKQQLVDFYKTEIEYNPPYLYSYVRKNELFGDFSEINLEDNPQSKDIAWQNVSVFEDSLPEKNPPEGNRQSSISGLSYGLKDGKILIKIDLRRKLDKSRGITINLLGYRRDRDFADMPKISAVIGILGMRIREKDRVIPVREARIKFEGRSLMISLPLSVLGDPQRILSRVRTRIANFPLDASAWRILRIK